MSTEMWRLFFRVVDSKGAQLFRLDEKGRASINYNKIISILKEPAVEMRGKKFFTNSDLI